MKPSRDIMKHHTGPVDVCIVGAGAAGSTLAKTLAEGGMSVVVLEAGPWLDTQQDFVNDELAMLGKIDWDDLRISGGNHPISLGRINTGRAVGGSTIHFTSIKLRLHPQDFLRGSMQGSGPDWPLTYDDLSPYYRKAEEFLSVFGPHHFPWGGFHGPYPHGELPLSAGDEVIARGFEKLGMRWTMSPHAILTGTKDGRSPCMYYGFCVNGCKSDAQSTALVTWIPAAVRAGAEVRDNSFALRINVDDNGHAKSVTYLHEGREAEQQAKIIIVSCYSIETPRLLLNSATGQCPDGLCNRSGQVGRNLMVHPQTEVYGRFPGPMDHFITPLVGIISQDPYGTQKGRDFTGGYSMVRNAHFPIDFIATLLTGRPDLWGKKMFDVMDHYTHWTSLVTMNEMLPRQDNRVTLARETDKNGVPVAHVTMSYDDNDNKMLQAAARHGEEVLRAGGADEILHTTGSGHLLGTCRMGMDPNTSVVDPFCRSHDVRNLFICDGSVFVTAGALNPSLTIEALALRTADHILNRLP
ncbi:MAG: GMC family oxidoreductase [SAR202 cluster bacterium]|nr:GMC family oxidoreductase [SAR202 cluster bacterium]